VTTLRVHPATLGRVAMPLLAGACAVAGVAWLDRFPEAGMLEITAALFTVSLCWMQRETGVLNLRLLTIAGVWFWTYLAMLLIPSLFVQGEHSGPTRVIFLAGVESLLITVPFGTWLVNCITGFRVVEIERFYRRDSEDRQVGEREFRWCLGGLAVAALLTLAYLAEVRTVPLFYMLRHPGESTTLVLLREQAFKLLASPLMPLYYLLRVMGYPLLIQVTLGFYLRERSRRWLLLFAASLGGGLFFAALAIAKAPVATIVLMLCLFLYMIYVRRISTRTLLLAGLAGSCLMVLFPLTVVLMVEAGSGVSAGIALLALGRRLFFLPSEVIYWYFTLFPGSDDFLHGRTIGKLAWLMGWQYFNAPNYVGVFGLGSWIESVNANGSFIGTLYADFGFAGVVIGGVVAGGLMQWLQVRLTRGPKTMPTLSVYAFSMFGFWLLHSTSLPIVLLTNGVGLVIAWPFLVKLFEPLADLARRRLAWEGSRS